MKLDSLTLPKAALKNINPTKKLVVYQYLYTDANDVEEQGLGPRGLSVEGLCEGATDRDAIEQACEAAGEKKLYFASDFGETDDRYYKVYTHPAQFGPLNEGQYPYTIECVCADSAIYDAAADTVIW